jgi:hypothetical protein
MGKRHLGIFVRVCAHSSQKKHSQMESRWYVEREQRKRRDLMKKRSSAVVR